MAKISAAPLLKILLESSASKNH